jgi:hypothetical protein
MGLVWYCGISEIYSLHQILVYDQRMQKTTDEQTDCALMTAKSNSYQPGSCVAPRS